ncbi:cadherin-related family member 5 isoform X3 [Xenopus laevis]|uniref:Cadherin-related family member 5 isoform X3 n=1 Tax=Xenopus laevis TaxID=8355 RepID=A0A8J1MVW9_XENLA|nr:cadherin-related family member 5 isoform X3 [Xenopus laevis]
MGSILALIILLFIPIGCMAQECRVDQDRVQIAENNDPGYVVTTIHTDPDYTMIVFDNIEWFEIKGTELLLKKSLDYENQTTLDVALHCRRNDATVKITRVYVTVLNVNDNPPMFQKSTYDFNVLEDTKVNTAIGEAIEAQDLDLDTIFYVLTGPDQAAADHFRLTAINNPVILVNQPLDYDKYNYIQLILTARDTQSETATPSYTATATINIKILDVDNKPPQFLPCRNLGDICLNDGYTTKVTRTEKVTGALVLNPAPLYAIDGDTGINAAIVYSIVNGNTGGIFDVERVSGNITMTKAADTLGIVLLQIMAAQVDDGRKYALTTVQIDVVEKNNNPPTFEKKNYLGTIQAQSAIGTFVTDSSSPNKPLRVFAADEDFADKLNPYITYVIQGGPGFTVSRDGYITNNALFDSPATITFSVRARDTTTGEEDFTDVEVEITPSVPTTTVSTTTSTTPGQGTTTTTTSGSGTTTTTTPGTGTTTTTTPGTGETGPGGDGYTATDMAALGATLGVLLALCLVGLGFLIHKQYGDQIRNRMSKSSGDDLGGSEDRTEQLIDDDDDADDNPDPGLVEVMPASISYDVDNSISKDPFVTDYLVLGAAAANLFANENPSNSPHAEKPEEGFDPDDKKEVKSILTKEFKDDPGYKSVWFREDASPEVVVIEGVEEGEADDGETEEGYNQEDDDDDDEDQLSPNFLEMNNDSNNFSQL